MSHIYKIDDSTRDVLIKHLPEESTIKLGLEKQKKVKDMFGKENYGNVLRYINGLILEKNFDRACHEVSKVLYEIDPNEKNALKMLGRLTYLKSNLQDFVVEFNNYNTESPALNKNYKFRPVNGIDLIDSIEATKNIEIGIVEEMGYGLKKAKYRIRVPSLDGEKFINESSLDSSTMAYILLVNSNLYESDLFFRNETNHDENYILRNRATKKLKEYIREGDISSFLVMSRLTNIEDISDSDKKACEEKILSCADLEKAGRDYYIMHKAMDYRLEYGEKFWEDSIKREGADEFLDIYLNKINDFSKISEHYNNILKDILNGEKKKGPRAIYIQPAPQMPQAGGNP